MDFFLLTFYFFPLLVSDVNVSNIYNSSEAVFTLCWKNTFYKLNARTGFPIFTGIFADFLE